VTEPFYAPRFEILLSGVTMAADLTEQVVSLTVETDLDMAGTFSLVLRNPDNVLLDSALLDIGKNVEVHLGYGADLVPAFLGEIAAVEPSFPQDGPPAIQVTGYDKSFKLRRNRPDPTTYSMTTDSMIAARIAVENGLIPIVDPTPELPEDITQKESDFAFLKARAQRYHYDVYVEWDRLHFQFPRPQFAAHVLEWGRNLSSFTGRISGAGLAGLEVIRGYNQELAQSLYAAAVAVDLDSGNLLERLGGSITDLLTSLVRHEFRDHAVKNPLDLADLATALLADLLEGLYEGQGSCVGLPALAAGQYVEIRGVGKRFSGTFRVRKVTHRLDSSGMRTEFVISQSGQTSLVGMLRDNVVEMPSPKQEQKFFGVLVGEVLDNHELAATPPEAPLCRVKVRFADLSDNVVTRWAPCVQPAAGRGQRLLRPAGPGRPGAGRVPERELRRAVRPRQPVAREGAAAGTQRRRRQHSPGDQDEGRAHHRLRRQRPGEVAYPEGLGRQRDRDEFPERSRLGDGARFSDHLRQGGHLDLVHQRQGDTSGGRRGDHDRHDAERGGRVVRGRR
jgi:phage protein D